MPAGDAGFERQPVDTAAIRRRLAEAGDLIGDYGSTIHVDGELSLAAAVLRLAKSVPLLVGEVDRLQAQLAAQQAVVDAARRWREPAPDCPAPWSSAMHFEHDCETARCHRLMAAVDEYNAAQAAQSEGEQG